MRRSGSCGLDCGFDDSKGFFDGLKKGGSDLDPDTVDQEVDGPDMHLICRGSILQDEGCIFIETFKINWRLTVFLPLVTP